MKVHKYVEDALKNLQGDGRGKILALIASGWFLSLGVRMVFPALLPFIRDSYNFDLTTAGLLLSILWLAYAVGQLPGGIFSDQIGEGSVMFLSTAITAGTILLISLSSSVLILFIGTGLLGFGTALYGVARFTSLSDIYPDQVGTAVGITMAAGDAGNTILPPLSGLIAAILAWQLGFAILVPLFIFVAIGLWVVVPAKTSPSENQLVLPTIKTSKGFFYQLNKPSIVYGVVTMIFCEYIWQAFTAFYPTYLIEIKGLPSPLANTLFGIFFALGGIIKVISGNAYDRTGVHKTLVVILIVSAGTFALLPFISGFWPLLIITVFASSFLGFATISLSYLTEAIPQEIKGTGLGFLRTIYLLIGSTSPLLFGFIADQGFFDESFFLLSLLSILAIGVVIKLPAP